MSIAQKAREERFAQLVASGKQATEAFREVTGKKRSGDYEQASRLLSKVENRIKEIQAATNSATVLTMKERREFIARLIRTPIADIDENDPLCQSVKYIESDRGSSKEFRVADKVSALMDDAKLAGELTEKIDIKDVTPREPLDVLRARIRLAGEMRVK